MHAIEYTRAEKRTKTRQLQPSISDELEEIQKGQKKSSRTQGEVTEIVVIDDEIDELQRALDRERLKADASVPLLAKK